MKSARCAEHLLTQELRQPLNKYAILAEHARQSSLRICTRPIAGHSHGAIQQPLRCLFGQNTQRADAAYTEVERELRHQSALSAARRATDQIHATLCQLRQ